MIVPLIGAATFSSGRDSAPAPVIGPGRILLIGKAEKHRVSVREDTAFLITIESQGGSGQRELSLRKISGVQNAGCTRY